MDAATQTFWFINTYDEVVNATAFAILCGNYFNY
jgi:hypothetical protein